MFFVVPLAMTTCARSTTCTDKILNEYVIASVYCLSIFFIFEKQKRFFADFGCANQLMYVGS